MENVMIDRTYRIHTSPVNTLAWSPDSSKIASGSDDGIVQVWNSVTGEKLLTYRGHHESVEAVSWSPTGTYLASGGVDNTIQVWNAASGDTTCMYCGHSYWIRRGLMWSPDGNRLASGSWDKTVRIWDASTGNTLLTYTGHSGVVCAVAWSPNSNSVASGGGYSDATVQIWDASTGEKQVVYAGHTTSVHALAWSPDGTSIVSGGIAEAVHRWNARTGKKTITYEYSLSETYTREGKRIAATDYCAGLVAWSPDQICIAAATNQGEIGIWNAHKADVLTGYQGQCGQIRALAWSPDGRHIAIGGSTGVVDILEISYPL